MISPYLPSTGSFFSCPGSIADRLARGSLQSSHPRPAPNQFALSVLFTILATLASGMPSKASGQSWWDPEFGIGLVRVEAFDATGHGFSFGFRWITRMQMEHVDHGVGFNFKFVKSDIAGREASPDKRALLGLGPEWVSRLQLLGGRLRPYISLPLQLVWSTIPDALYLAGVSAADSVFRAPHDRVGTELGIGVGTGVGCEFWPSRFLGLGGEVAMLHQALYDGADASFVLLSFFLTSSVSGLLDVL